VERGRTSLYAEVAIGKGTGCGAPDLNVPSPLFDLQFTTLAAEANGKPTIGEIIRSHNGGLRDCSEAGLASLEQLRLPAGPLAQRN